MPVGSIRLTVTGCIQQAGTLTHKDTHSLTHTHTHTGHQSSSGDSIMWSCGIWSGGVGQRESARKGAAEKDNRVLIIIRGRGVKTMRRIIFSPHTPTHRNGR